MDLTIQPFRNNDLSAVCEIWNAHHAVDAGSGWMATGGIQSDRMELFAQSKIYFESEQLLIARLEQQPVGFIHLCGLPSDSQEALLSDQMGIAALCIKPSGFESAVAKALLEAADKFCVSRGGQRLVMRPALPHCSFYLGIGPADSLASTLSTEGRLCGWLNAAGYKPAIPTTIWELPLNAFRVPGDRIQILVRRRSAVDRQLEEPTLPWWQACVLGHAEVTAFHLFDRVEKRALQEVILWGLAPELTRGSQAVCWMWPPSLDYSPEDAPVEIAPIDRLVFLLAEALRDLQQERVEVVRTVTNSEANQMHAGLQRLGFRATESGMVFEKCLLVES